MLISLTQVRGVLVSAWDPLDKVRGALVPA